MNTTPPAISTAVVGLQWGDEGKGKVVDLLAAEHDAIVRYNGGANAGHSVVVGGERFSLHLIPSGILHAGKPAVIGNGVVVDPAKLLSELDALVARGVDTSGLVVSDRAHVVAPYHKAEDEFRELTLSRAPLPPDAPEGAVTREIGTTRRGIGPAYADKVQRSTAVRIGDLLRPAVLRERVALACMFKNTALAVAPGAAARPAGDIPGPPFDAVRIADDLLAAGARIRPLVRDTTYLLHDLLSQGKRLLFEGANATLLDVDHGTFPFVTASTCAVFGIGPGTGVSERRLGRVLGVMKAYTTRVGRGPMPTELADATGEAIRQRGREFGTTTGRPRRVGWLDLVAVKYSAMLNGVTGIALTMLDVLEGHGEFRACTAYKLPSGATERFIPDGADLARAEPVLRTFKGFKGQVGTAKRRADLPDAARAYLEFIEEFVGVPIDVVSVGPGREQTIFG